jgi:hypothetical protein
MNDSQTLATPVAFLIFNRPATTQRVFDEIARARPRKLLVIADGPRAGRSADRVNVAAARAIVERINWPCEVLKNYSEKNLGCRERVSSGIDWVFSEVEEAIILEDDCVPHPSFFSFCEAMLSRYRDDERIMHVSGDNFQQGVRRSRHSYYFSRIAHVWGWATWRRAWKKYDVQMPAWPELRFKGIARQMFPVPNQAAFWEGILDDVHSGAVDAWDVQWVLTCWAHGGLSIVPELNLVSNIGAGEEATNTKLDQWYMNLPTCDLGEITHPTFFLPDADADDFTMKEHFFCPGSSVEREAPASEPVARKTHKAAHASSGLRNTLKKFRQWTAPIRHPWREIQRAVEAGIRKEFQRGRSTAVTERERTAQLLDQLAREMARLQQRIEVCPAAAAPFAGDGDEPTVVRTIGPVRGQQPASGNRKAG